MLVHELHHALGFTDQLFDKFIDEAGQPIPEEKVRRWILVLCYMLVTSHTHVSYLFDKFIDEAGQPIPEERCWLVVGSLAHNKLITCHGLRFWLAASNAVFGDC